MGEVDLGLVEGSAGSNSVTFRSPVFKVTAKKSKGGIIECKTERNCWLWEYLYKHPNFPMLRTVRSELKLVSMFSRKTIILAAVGIAVFFCAMLVVMIYVELHYPGSITGMDGSMSSMKDQPWRIYLYMAPFLPFFILSLYRRRPWYGAAQMALQARSADMGEIVKHGRFYPKSPERFYVPFIAGSLVSFAVVAAFHVDRTWIGLAIAEAILWTDALYGLENIPVTARLSNLIQSYLTAVPGPEHLEVAQAAMRALIEAHHTL